VWFLHRPFLLFPFGGTQLARQSARARAVEQPRARQVRHQTRKAKSKKEEQERRWRNHAHSRTDSRQGRKKRKSKKDGGATTRTLGKTSDKEGRRARKDRTRKGGGGTTRTPGQTRKEEEQERTEQERAVEEPPALQGRHQTRKEKEAQLEFLAPVWFHERHWLSTSPPCAPFPLFHEYFALVGASGFGWRVGLTPRRGIVRRVKGNNDFAKTEMTPCPTSCQCTARVVNS
jgi:hypothetical protein